MKKTMLSAAMIVAASLSAPAMADDNSFYLGASLGQTKVNFEEVSGVEIKDDKDTSWKIFAGYNLNENVAFELTYHDFGKSEAVVSSVDVDVEAEGYSLSVLGKLPVSEQFGLFGRLGYIHVDAEAEASGVTANGDADDVLFGIGAEYAVSEAVSLRAEWERVNTDDELNTFSAGISYNF
ncbi:MAG: porin [Amphritea sp.]|nr:porin [Amphritea sp.]